jgi:hypothetical protein
MEPKRRAATPSDSLLQLTGPSPDVYETRAVELIDLRKALVSRAAALMKAAVEGRRRVSLRSTRGGRHEMRHRLTSRVCVVGEVDDLVPDVKGEDIGVLGESGDSGGVWTKEEERGKVS